MSSLKQPPTFDPSRGDCYADWKSDVEIWGVYTKSEKSRRGPAVYLSLVGDAREAVRSLKVADLAQDHERLVRATAKFRRSVDQEIFGYNGDKDRKDAEQSKGQSWSLFKFGDGKESKSNHELAIPMFVGGKMMKIDVDVVDNDIPLLIGRPTMTKLGMVVDKRITSESMDKPKLQCGAFDPVTEGWGCDYQEFLVEVEKLLKENPDVRDGEKANRFERQQDTEEKGTKQVPWIEDDSDSDDEEQEVPGEQVEEATGQQENTEV
eukprot:gene6732-7490_t